MDKIEIFWLVATIVLFGVEAATVTLVSIWFALGALAALITALCGGQLLMQIVVFFVVTILTLIATRPLVKKYFNRQHHEPTNADMLIGKICVVSQDIDNLAATGEVKCSGSTWTARSLKGDIIKQGSKAKVHSIEGVKLIVEPLMEHTEAE